MKWVGVMALALAGAAEAGARCDAVKIDRLPVCVDGANGLVFGSDRAQAEAILAAIETGRPKFEALFGRPAAAYAVVFDSPTRDEIAMLKAAGYPVTLPWIDASRLVAEFEQKLRDAITEKLPNLSKEQIDAIIASKLDELSASIGGPSAAAHEMGHLWFTHAFWASVMDSDAPITHYGSPAPDWLDEISGLAFEDDAMAADRRQRFKDLWTKGEGIAPLPAYLAMPHPELDKALERARSEPRAAGEGGKIVVGAEASDGAVATSAFYAQGRVFADFLIAVAKPGVLGVIATAMADGKTFEAWLATDGAAQGLPADLAGLETRWIGWATAAYGVPD